MLSYLRCLARTTDEASFKVLKSLQLIGRPDSLTELSKIEKVSETIKTDLFDFKNADFNQSDLLAIN